MERDKKGNVQSSWRSEMLLALVSFNYSVMLRLSEIGKMPSCRHCENAQDIERQEANARVCVESSAPPS